MTRLGRIPHVSARNTMQSNMDCMLQASGRQRTSIHSRSHLLPYHRPIIQQHQIATSRRGAGGQDSRIKVPLTLSWPCRNRDIWVAASAGVVASSEAFLPVAGCVPAGGEPEPEVQPSLVCHLVTSRSLCLASDVTSRCHQPCMGWSFLASHVCRSVFVVVLVCLVSMLTPGTQYVRTISSSSVVGTLYSARRNLVFSCTIFHRRHPSLL